MTQSILKSGPSRRCVALVASLCITLAVSGCSTSAEPEAQESPEPEVTLAVSKNLSGDARFEWEREPKPYRVRDLTVTATSKSQSRIAHVVMEYPETKAAVLAAAREIFDALWEDITNLGAADFQRIQVLVFCCEEDAIDNDGFHIFEAFGGGLHADILPKFKNAKLEWQWREPADKPDDDTLAVFRDYWDGQQQLYSDDPKAEAELVSSIANKHGLSHTAVAEKVAVCWLWRNRHEMNEKRKSYQTESFLQQWGFGE